jgi:hypothetical protein
MTKRFIFLLAGVFIAVVACDKDADKGGDKNPAAASSESAPATPTPKAEEAAPLVLTALTLTDAGIKATIQAPEGAEAKDSYGTTEVKVGDGSTFFLQIDKGAPDLSAVKKTWQKNDMQKLQKLHVETEDVLIAETEMFGKTSFWLDAKVSLGDQVLHCKSGRGAPSYTRAQIDTFLTACQSLKTL